MADEVLLVKRGDGCKCDVDLSRGQEPRIGIWRHADDGDGIIDTWMLPCPHGSTVETIPLSRLLPEGVEWVECEDCDGTGTFYGSNLGETVECASCLGSGYRVRPAT